MEAVETLPKSRTLVLCLLGLAAFLGWEALALRSYMRADSRPPAREEAVQLRAALDTHEEARTEQRQPLGDLAPVLGRPWHPPLHYYLLSRAMDAGNPAESALWLNWFYLAVLCAAIFGITWHLSGDALSLLAALIFAGAPAVQGIFHAPLMDLGLVAWTTAAYWALVHSEEFERWPESLAFGIIFALGMLHDWSFCSYLLPAFLVGLQALTRSGRRAKVLAAAALALAGFGPWYWRHLPQVALQLLQTASELTNPLEQGQAVLIRLTETIDGMGPLFFLLSVIGITIPQHRRHWRHGWILGAWFVLSCAFWLLLPPHSLLRLLPALPALAAAGLGAWPKSVVWGLAALQMFTMVNFTAGWIKPVSVSFPVASPTFFPSRPPVLEDWKIADILTTAEQRADPALPVADLALIANDTRFNIATFDWMARLLRLSRVRVRPVTDRLCDFCEFVLLKNGRLGTEGLTGGLSEAAGTVRNPKSWFAMSYAQVAAWPLPDGSNAVLYQQKSLAAPPLQGRRLTYQYYVAGPLEARNLVIELGAWDATRAAYSSAALSAETNIGAVRAELEGLRFMPIYAHGTWTDFRALRLDLLRIKSFRVHEDVLRAFLEDRFKGLRITGLTLNGTLQLQGTLGGGIPFSADISVQFLGAPPILRCALREARLGTTLLPEILLRPFQTIDLPLTPTPELPFTIAAPGLTIAGGWLSVP